jgi:hypothetical protein
MRANPSANSTRTCLVWVDYVPPSLNRTLGQHWTVSHQNKKKARAAWAKAVAGMSALSFFGVESSTGTTLPVAAKHSGTPLPDGSDAMTPNGSLLGNTASNERKGS